MTLWVGASKGKSPSGKFGGHGHCGSKDIMVLIFHVISQDQVTKGQSNSLCRSPLR